VEIPSGIGISHGASVNDAGAASWVDALAEGVASSWGDWERGALSGCAPEYAAQPASAIVTIHPGVVRVAILKMESRERRSVSDTVSIDGDRLAADRTQRPSISVVDSTTPVWLGSRRDNVAV
jgi:hypothetical protein